MATFCYNSLQSLHQPELANHMDLMSMSSELVGRLARKAKVVVSSPGVDLKVLCGPLTKFIVNLFASWVGLELT